MIVFRSAALASAVALMPACNLAWSPDEGSAEQTATSQHALTASDDALLLPSDIAFNAGFGRRSPRPRATSAPRTRARCTHSAAAATRGRCSPECPCGHGQGDCDGPEDCTTGLCLRDVGLAFGFNDREIDVCSNVCPIIGNGAGNFCTPECPCYGGQGDCDTSADCHPGLTCVQNQGASWGQPADTDICM